MIDFKALAAPFPPEEVSWRLGSTSKEKKRGLALAYLDARNVMDRLDDVCGPACWQATYPHANAKTVCSIGILCGDNWVWKTNGAGDSDIEAEKGAMSDAFKRAAVLWGIGRYLYMLDSPWVEVEETRPGSGKFQIRKGEYKNLDMVLRRFNQAYASGQLKQPSAISLARDGIAEMQNNGEQPTIPQKTDARKAAEKFLGDSIATLEKTPGIGGTVVKEWLNMPCSPKGKVCNRDAMQRLAENFPDLHDRLTTVLDEVRLRGGVGLQ